MVFFNFFSEYLAYYQSEVVNGVTTWTKYPLLTPDFNLVLPILTGTLITSIVCHSVAIALDRHIMRQTFLIILNALGMVTVLTFLRVFPFDFSVIPNAGLATALPTAAVAVFIIITIGLGIGALVRFIRLMIHVSKRD